MGKGQELYETKQQKKPFEKQVSKWLGTERRKYKKKTLKKRYNTTRI